MSATNRGSLRHSQDKYMTPVWCVHELLRGLNRPVKSFLEPCRGTGNIYNHVGADRKFSCEIDEGVNYFNTPCPQVELIITNPPFRFALPFLKKSLTEADTVCYLLRLNFLGSQKRKPFWQANPPTNLVVLSRRPSFTFGGTDATEYAWFIWDRAKLFNFATISVV